MKLSRLALPAALICLVGGLLALAQDLPPSRVEGPATLGELDEALTRTTQRMETLLELAGKDPRFKDVEKYRAYTLEDFANRRREVTADKLLDILIDKDAPQELRELAFEAMTSEDATRYDPDLKLVLPRGQARPRADWCRTKVTKLLLHKEPMTRQFAHNLLIAYFPAHVSDPPVISYDARNGSRAQWRKAKDHWNKVLRK